MGMFILQIFALLCLLLVMTVVLIIDFKSRPFNARVLFPTMAMVLLLGVVVTFEYITRVNGDLIGVTWCTFLGFASRPFCIYGFVLFARRKMGRMGFILLAPLLLSVLIHASAFFLEFEPLGHLVFYYTAPTSGTELVYHRGPLGFTSHVLAAIYLAIIVYLSFRRLQGKHRYETISILFCAVFVVVAVVLEMMGVVMGALNIAIAISIVFYYLFLLKEENRRDALTGLFDRKSFYADVERFARNIRGLIALDMNGLKLLNDEQGHASGDVALKNIAGTLEGLCDSKMYAYRMGGDEFMILILNAELDYALVEKRIKEELEAKGLSASFGHALRKETTHSIEDLMKSADEAMYADKAAFYQNHPRADRRRK